MIASQPAAITSLVALPALTLQANSPGARALSVVLIFAGALVAVLVIRGALGALMNATDKVRTGGHHRGYPPPSKPLIQKDSAEYRQRRAGEVAEEQVALALGEAAYRGHCYVFNNVREPSAGDIDHLVLGPGGATIVETKANTGILEWDGDPGSEILIDGEPMPRDPIAQMRRQVNAFERRFSYQPKSEGRGARPLTEMLGPEGKYWLWCFTRAELPGGYYPDDPHLCSLESVVASILWQPPLFEPGEVDYMAGRVARAYGIEPDAAPPGPAVPGRSKDGR